VDIIEEHAFDGCSSLSSITNRSIVPDTVDENVFAGVDMQNCTLLVPANAVDVYRKAYVWRKFGNIDGIPVF
jgi:hypothetical protein